MAKILKNTTGVDIVVQAFGQTIPASSQATVDHTDYQLLATEDVVTELTPAINSGDIVVNDGTTDLSAAVGLDHISRVGGIIDADRVYFDNSGPIFTESSPEDVQEAIVASSNLAQVALDTPRYSIILEHNGRVRNNTFLGYSSLIPGDATPIIVPIKSELIELSFSNSRSNADYTIEIRKNTTTGPALYSISKTNTQFFVEDSIDLAFNQGDQIYIKYIDEGTNANDATVVLYFKAIP